MDQKFSSEEILYSIKGLIQAFIVYCEKDRNLSVHTIKAYKLDLNQFYRFFSQKGVFDLRHLDKNDYRDFLRSKNHLKPRSINRKIATLKAFTKYLVIDGISEENTMHNLLHVRQKVPLELPKIISNKNLTRLFNHLVLKYNSESLPHRKKWILRDWILCELLYSTGIRIGEACKLKLDDFLFDDGVIIVKGKGSKQRLAPICNRNLELIIQKYIKQFHSQTTENPFFFLNRNLKPLSEQSARNIIKKCGKSVGLKNVTPHVFRHSIATQLLENGVDLRYIQKLLGHSNIVTTTIYANIGDRVHIKYIKKMHPRNALCSTQKLLS